jgi:hypothetical protein
MAEGWGEVVANLLILAMFFAGAYPLLHSLK